MNEATLEEMVRTLFRERLERAARTRLVRAAAARQRPACRTGRADAPRAVCRRPGRAAY